MGAGQDGMSSVRDFIRDKLSAAAQQIFCHFEETADRRSGPLDPNRRGRTSSSNRTDVPQQHSYTEQILMDQLDPEPVQIKEEPEELDWDQLESRTFILVRFRSESEEIFAAAAEKLFSVFVQFQEELDRRHRPLPVSEGPSPGTEAVCKEEEEVVTDEELCHQEEAEPPHIKEEDDDSFDTVIVTYDDSDLSDPGPDPEPTGSCQICGEDCSQSSHLKTHLRTDTGKVPLSEAEHLFMAAVGSSEEEDLSDPSVDEHLNLFPAELQDDDSEDEYFPPDSPEEDSDEDESAPDAAEDGERRRGHSAHKRRRADVEDAELDEDQRGPGAGWTSAPFRPDLVQFQGEEDRLRDGRAAWQPQDYVEQYLDSELMKVLADCTNSTSLAKSGTSLNTSVEEVYHFFGAAVLMSCVRYPQTRMFWSNSLRIPAIGDTMSRDRFFKLRSNLKAVVDEDVPGHERQRDKFWKVRPFVNRVLYGCRLQTRPGSVSVEEQVIPFTGAGPVQHRVLLKPSPVGIKTFVLASVDGLVLDFEVYQGVKTLRSQVQDSVGLGLGALVIQRLSETLAAGTRVYCDQAFMSGAAAELMMRRQVYLTGPVRKNRVLKATKKLPSDRTLKRCGPGASAATTRADGRLCLVKWSDKKPMLFLSAAHAEEPKDTCRRWSKEDKDYVTITRPSVARHFNATMGGVKLSDRMLSCYRMSVRSKKWTVCVLMHFTDLALVNSWLLYRRDQQDHGAPPKSIMRFLEFRMAVAQVFLNKRDLLLHAEPGREEERPPQSGRRSRVVPVPHVSIRTCSAAHLPEMADLKNPKRCRGQGCSGKSRVRCTKCNVFLCLQSERNCFAAFHQRL
ncbi:piggyBac transposable element-derived protein 3 isoform X2 [Austrofundulus limnaeus]|uniref:PiggyBac transposable element-derived protein 3 isoform X2 n=1 Tax=Austrofundulus limnaeus TaxID=52670 RepID=A0A2I4CSC7_AUSLI|nr:PREDICTED: piggyBac transposable element-derived protein 3-like isoform X2 [Austrofundulus limnaeus]